MRELDHSKHILEYAKAGIPCYSSKECFEGLNIKHHNLIALQARKRQIVEGFDIMPFTLVHDVINFGYLINHEESGLIVFITDTHYCKYTFPKIAHWLIEANYSQAIMESRLLESNLHIAQYMRTEESHMSIETCKQLLLANDLSETVNVVLLHLSNGNSNAKDFKKQIEEATGKPTYIADKGLVINLNKNSF